MNISNHPVLGKLVSIAVSVITAVLGVWCVAIAFAYCLLKGINHSS